MLSSTSLEISGSSSCKNYCTKTVSLGFDPFWIKGNEATTLICHGPRSSPNTTCVECLDSCYMTDPNLTSATTTISWLHPPPLPWLIVRSTHFPMISRGEERETPQFRKGRLKVGGSERLRRCGLIPKGYCMVIQWGCFISGTNPS